MKNNLLLAFCLFYVCQLSMAQNNFFVSAGTTVNLVGGPTLTLSGVSLVTNGSFMGVANSTVIVKNTTNGTIGGTGFPTFARLVLTNNSGLQMGGNMTINNQLDVLSPLNVKNNTIVLGVNATIVNESETNRLIADAGNTGFAGTTRNFAAPLVSENPANLGVEFVSAPALGTTTIRRFFTAPVIAGITSIKRYYNIVPTNNTNLNASVRFKYFDAELNGIPEGALFLWKSTNNGVTWTQVLPDARDATQNWLQKNNVSEFGFWTIGASNTVLPLVLSSFNTDCTDKGADLVWATASEHNTALFIIEKSKDGVKWEAIGEMTAKGSANAYKFSDTEGGNIYYRLKQIDKDGQFTYSKTLSSTCGLKSITLMVYPNPATDYTELVFDSRASFKTQLQIYTSDGRLVKNIPTSVEAGANKIGINLTDLTEGTYFIRMNDPNLKMSKTLIKQ